MHRIRGPLAAALFVLALAVVLSPRGWAGAVHVTYFDVPQGSGPHDVAPAPDGSVWFTAQRASALGLLDPSSGKVQMVPLGSGSAPHGVIIGPDGAAWVTDGGQNAIVRVDPKTHAVTRFPLPETRDYANLNTASFDRQGTLWFTGQNGIIGRLASGSERSEAWRAPKGIGPYGITTTPSGAVFFVSLAGSYLGRIDLDTHAVTVIEPPTPGAGTRRVWTDSKGTLWMTEWYAGNLAAYDTAKQSWQAWRLPGSHPMPYAVYVDERDMVWVSDFGEQAILRFDPATQRFESFKIPRRNADVRQLNGRKGEVWGGESGTDHLIRLAFE
ncbi:MAG TPA: hypothetical protein VEU47_13120 [Candidatus Cybelea sp.]|nr:hypothetical protein [Candidatus Cybelea sp.]